MALLDALALPDLPAEEPAGPNLEFDADFGALDRAAQGKPEVQYGNTIEPAVPPEWKEVEALALSLLARTRDLRVMTHLAVARLHLAGLPGFAQVLTGIRTLLETQWEQVHPQLDPDDDLDPVQRANALFQLRDPAKVLRPLRDLPLAGSARTGWVSWRDVAIASGTVEPEAGKEKLTEAAIRGAFAVTDGGRRQATREAAEQAVREATAIPAAFDANAGSGTGPDLQDLTKLLRDVSKELARFEPPPESGGEADAAADAASPSGDGSAPAGQPTAAASGPRGGFASVKSITAVSRRDDALHLLDLASAYFREHEPSSPLPMLIDRARRLASLGFMEILRDLAPDGLQQAQVVAGPKQDGDDAGSQSSSSW